jgi:hypothetical protein
MSRANHTHEQFLEKLMENNIHFSGGDFKVVGVYEGIHKKIKVSDGLGEFLVEPHSLLMGSRPTMQTCTDKEAHLQKRIDKDYKIVSKYLAADKPILVENKYGVHKTRPKNLLSGSRLTIQTAVDPTKYYIARAREIHGDRYDYSKVEYVNMSSNITVICKIHGEIQQTAQNHLNSSGCKKCSDALKGGRSFSNWRDRCPRSPGIFYILRCWNEEEEFYKVGITCRSVKKRYAYSKEMPYNYEVIKEFVSEDRKEIWDLEKETQRKLKQYKYKPKITFGGSIRECFSKII